MVMSTYDSLGKVTNSLVDRLRDMGFQAQASHPLGGLALYPPLAIEAGLGWIGRHGLLITPQFGPRQRIAAIFINVDNLPIAKTNEHSWIGEFCNQCGKCIKTCPANAILDQQIKHSSERKTHIIRGKCLPVFVSQEGCSICIKECTFSQKNYYDLRKM
jgi:epoxyqueuosine reductase QueG